MLFLCDIFETEGLQPITVSVTFALFQGYRTLEMIQFWSLFECWTECLPILCIIFVLLNPPPPVVPPPLLHAAQSLLLYIYMIVHVSIWFI